MGNASNFRRWIGGASNAQSEYVSPSIKDQERTRRGTRNKCFEISGPEQIQSTSGKDLVKNQTFKEEFFGVLISSSLPLTGLILFNLLIILLLSTPKVEAASTAINKFFN